MKLYRTIILPVVFETWLLTLRVALGLRVFENRVLRRIFGPRREWRKIHNEEITDCAPHPVLFG